MPGKVTDISTLLNTSNPVVKVLRQGWAKNFSFIANKRAADGTLTPVDISGENFTATATRCEGRLSGTRITNFKEITPTEDTNLTVTIDADQARNTGRLSIFAPGNLSHDATLEYDADTLPMFVVRVKWTKGTDTPIKVFLVAYRRGDTITG